MLVKQPDVALLPPSSLATVLYSGGTGEEVRVTWVNTAAAVSRLEYDDGLGSGFVLAITAAIGVTSYDSGLLRLSTRLWRIRHESTTNSNYSSSVGDPTFVATPTGVSAAFNLVSPVGTKTTVAWSNAKGIYAIDVRKNVGSPASQAGGTTAFNDTVSLASTDTWDLRHTYRGFVSAWTSPVSVTTIPAPTVPTTVLYSTTKVRVGWTRAVQSGNTFASYTVRLEKDEGSGFVFVANTAANATTYDSALDQSSVRSWRVRNEFGGVVSAWTTSVADPGITPPTSLAATNVSAATRLTWVNANGVWGLELQRNDTGSTWVADSAFAGGTVIDNTGLTPSSTRSWRLRHAYNGFVSAWVTVIDPAVPVPTNVFMQIHADDPTFGEDLLWDQDASVSQVQIQRSDGTLWSFDTGAFSSTPGTNRLYSSTIERTSISGWRIRSVSGSEFSEWVGAASFAGVDDPAGLALSVVGGNVAVDWTQSPSLAYNRCNTQFEWNTGSGWTPYGTATGLTPAEVGALTISGPPYSHTRTFQTTLVPQSGRQWRARNALNGFISGYTTSVTEPVLKSIAGSGSASGTASGALTIVPYVPPPVTLADPDDFASSTYSDGGLRVQLTWSETDAGLSIQIWYASDGTTYGLSDVVGGASSGLYQTGIRDLAGPGSWKIRATDGTHFSNYTSPVGVP